MTRLAERCTFRRDGQWCGRQETDESVHVWPDERMRPGAHVWRHDRRDGPALELALSTPELNLPTAARSDDYRAGYQAGHQAGRMARRSVSGSPHGAHAYNVEPLEEE